MITTNNRNKDCLVFDPTSTAKTIWELSGLFMIIYQAIIIPYRLCFDDEASGFLLGVEDVIDVCFILDILVQFNSGYFKRG